MFEHKSQPLASKKKFYNRIFKAITFSFALIFVCLMIGIFGYHYTDNISWIDSLHNASMILAGMGPVVNITSDIGKYFSSFYALFSGIIFISNVGLILAPMAHRLFHRMNLED